MTETKIRNALADFCKSGDIKKVKAMYTILEADMATTNVWDEEFIRETERREKSFLDGSAQMYSLEEAKQAAKKELKTKQINNNGFPI